MNEWKMRLEGQCPFCYRPLKDNDHILRCDNEDSIKVWDNTIQEFDNKLERQDTLPALRYAIITELHHWRKKSRPQITSYSNIIQPCIKQQREIGWGQFLEGLISKKMIDLQHD